MIGGDKTKRLRSLTLAAVLLAVGIVLPLLTAQIKEIGDTLLPMHIPVLLCGLLCGPQYGLLVGLLLPFLRSFIFSMPPLYPNAVWMALELATYGLVVGILYMRVCKRGVVGVYVSLIPAMLAGRLVWGAAKYLLLGMAGKAFTLQAFLAGALLDAVPGIVIQLTLIPLLMVAIRRATKRNTDNP